MRDREIIARCSEMRIKHMNTLCWQNVGFFNVKPLGFKDLNISFIKPTTCAYDITHTILQYFVTPTCFGV